jgi:hypothetical protein
MPGTSTFSPWSTPTEHSRREQSRFCHQVRSVRSGADPGRPGAPRRGVRGGRWLCRAHARRYPALPRRGRHPGDHPAEPGPPRCGAARAARAHPHRGGARRIAVQHVGRGAGRQRILNLQTTYGELDLTIRPAAFEGGYDELATRALRRSVGNVQVRVAALADVIRSKEAAGRRKDQEALPELYQLAGAPANHRRTPGHRRLPPAASPPRPTPSSASPPPGSAPPGATVTVPHPGGSPVRPAAPGGNLPATGGLAAPGEPVRRHTALHGNDFPARQGYAWTSSRRCRPDRRPVPGSGGAIAVRTAG